MKCQFCNCPDSRVVDSRPTEEGASIRRRRECVNCGRRFTTYEKVELPQLLVIKKDNTRELFDAQKIRTNNVIERLNREIRRRTRVVGTFPDGNSALMLVCARLRHVAGTQWGNRKYMSMKHLEALLDDASVTA